MAWLAHAKEAANREAEALEGDLGDREAALAALGDEADAAEEAAAGWASLLEQSSAAAARDLEAMRCELEAAYARQEDLEKSERSAEVRIWRGKGSG